MEVRHFHAPHREEGEGIHHKNQGKYVGEGGKRAMVGEGVDSKEGE